MLTHSELRVTTRVQTTMDTLRILIGPDNGDASPLQLCARAALLFIFGIICIRVAGRRTFSQYSPLDIIVAIVVGSNISRIMTGKASFVPGAAATFALVLIHRGVAMAALRWPALGRIVKCQPVELIRDGRMDWDKMKAHEISESDLLEGLRLEKVGTPDDVALAMLEGGGRISVIKKND